MAFDFSLVATPFRMQPGLRRIAAGAAQLTPSRPGGRHLREKSAVLAAFAGEAIVSVPRFDALPAVRVIAAEAARIAQRDGGVPAFTVEPAAAGGLRWRAPKLGWAVDASGVHPDGSEPGDPALRDLLTALPEHLRFVALLCLAFEEDFAVIDGATGALPWLAVCLPSRWAPASKVGRHFAAVHAPVADNALLVGAADSLARLVTRGERWERFVWTVSADPHLHQHPARGEPLWPTGDDDAAIVAAIVAAASFRTEHQTFLPAPEVGQAVFTIHVESAPLATAAAAPEAAGRLHDAIASMTPAVLAYRGLAGVREPLLRALALRAAGAAWPGA